MDKAPSFVWLKAEEDNSVVLTTRCRIARNVAGIPFYERDAHKAVCNRLFMNIAGELGKNRYQVQAIKKLKPSWVEFMLDHWLISRELSRTGGGYVAYTPANGMSVMLGEEDHVRIQSMMLGSRIWETLARAYSVEEKLGSKYRFAYHPKYGYLTTCPTNIGTGLRLSALVHIRGLHLLEGHQEVLEGLSKQGLEIRGFRGEGSYINGPLVQVSNRTTLGFREIDFAEHFFNTLENLTKRENRARATLKKKNKLRTLDLVQRAVATLGNAHLMDYDEAMAQLSLYYLGLDCGFVSAKTRYSFGYFLAQLTDSNLWTKLKKNGTSRLSGEQFLKKRAAVLRNIFAK